MTPDQSSNAPAAVIPDNSAAPVPEKKVDAPVAEAPPAAVAPEEYEIELTDDSPLSDEDLNEIAEEAGRLGLSKDDAQKLVSLKENAYKKGVSTEKEAYNAKLKADYDNIQKDPIFQGDQKAKTFESMSRAIETFGDDDLVKLVNTPEFGNNIVIARFLKRLGDALAPDDKGLTGGSGSTGASQDKSNDALKTLYPSFFEDKK